MRWLLDTNVLSESVRNRPNPRVLRWLGAQPSNDLAISIVTVAEIRDGVATAPGTRQAILSSWADTQITALFEGRVVPTTEDVLIDWIQVSRKLRIGGKSRQAADVLIASTARVHNLTLVTRNVRDFADTGAVVYDPWNDQTHRMEQP